MSVLHGNDNQALGVNLPEQTSFATPDTSRWGLYFKSTGVYIIDDAGTETQLANYTGAPTFSDLTISDSDTPTLTITDTTTPVTVTLSANDSVATLQTTTSNNLVLGTNGTAAITINTSQAVTLAGNLTLSAGTYAQNLTSTATSGAPIMVNKTLTATPSGVSTGFYIGESLLVTSSGSNSMASATMLAAGYNTIHANTTALSIMYGISSTARLASGGGSVSLAVGAYYDVQNESANIIADGRALWIKSATNSGGGAITTNYGLKIEDQTVGGTNYAIFTGTGQVDFGDTCRAAGFISDADPGSGVASTVTYTSATDTPTTDPGWTTSSTVNMNAPDGYVKGYVGTQAVVFAYWNT